VTRSVLYLWSRLPNIVRRRSIFIGSKYERALVFASFFCFLLDVSRLRYKTVFLADHRVIYVNTFTIDAARISRRQKRYVFLFPKFLIVRKIERETGNSISPTRSVVRKRFRSAELDNINNAAPAVFVNVISRNVTSFWTRTSPRSNDGQNTTRNRSVSYNASGRHLRDIRDKGRLGFFFVQFTP